MSASQSRLWETASTGQTPFRPLALGPNNSKECNASKAKYRPLRHNSCPLRSTDKLQQPIRKADCQVARRGSARDFSEQLSIGGQMQTLARRPKTHARSHNPFPRPRCGGRPCQVHSFQKQRKRKKENCPFVRNTSVPLHTPTLSKRRTRSVMRNLSFWDCSHKSSVTRCG